MITTKTLIDSIEKASLSGTPYESARQSFVTDFPEGTLTSLTAIQYNDPGNPDSFCSRLQSKDLPFELSADAIFGDAKSFPARMTGIKNMIDDVRRGVVSGLHKRAGIKSVSCDVLIKILSIYLPSSFVGFGDEFTLQLLASVLGVASSDDLVNMDDLIKLNYECNQRLIGLKSGFGSLSFYHFGEALNKTLYPQHMDGFIGWLKSEYTKTKTSAKEYPRFIRILSLHDKVNYFSDDLSIADLEALYSEVSKHQKDKVGEYYYVHAPAYGTNGHYSAAVKQLIEYRKSIISSSSTTIPASSTAPTIPSASSFMASSASAPTPPLVSTSYDYPYRKYLTAIKSKPFLLLAGLSGTGKSRLARELARACWDSGTAEYEAHKPKNFELIQVKPNWHDSSELIGYYSRIAKANPYIIGPFLRFMAKAIQDPDMPYILCLDEMNLAPVEQYFAEFLSVIETRKVKDGKVVTDPIIDFDSAGYKDLIKALFPDKTTQDEYLAPSDEKLRKYLSIPQNLIVIGTVNMDESTYSFSRKVLDRAMSIEMNEVNLHSGLDSRYEPIGESGKIGFSDLIGGAVEGVDVYSSYKAICDRAIDYLKAINDVLEGTPFKVAYRTRNEFLLYVVNNLPYCIDESGGVVDENKILARALDEITSMKVLSRIEGDETKVDKKLLESLSTAIGDQLKAISALEYAAEASASAELSISMAKLKEMISRLDSGFTSFWS